MRNIFVIMRRDLGAYFTSPIGYIFMMVFVTITVGLYITSFFVFPVADMRPYFENLPLFLCVFMPAVTMRIWAEERKENTWELLLTFPMKAWELVLGKFFAALVFFMLTLAATATVPLMLADLGNPDFGAIFSGYLGTLLLGAFFLSLGIFFSGFFKDQIVAFVVTLLAALSFFLLGMGFIAAYIDDKVAGLGSLLQDVLGIFTHYGPFIRGVIDLADVVFFVVWTALFLLLNVLYIEGRNRPGAKTLFATAVVVCVAIGLLFNWLMVGQSFARADMTEDNIYTVSPASVAILEELDAPVQVNYYVTPSDKMPTQMKNLEQDVLDKLEELRVASDGKLQYTTRYLDVANINTQLPGMQPEEEEEPEDAEEALENRMLDKGVEPFTVAAFSEGEQSTRLVYSSLGIAYKDRAEEIIPQIMPQVLPELEYRLLSTVYKLSLEEPPVIALVAPMEALQIDPQMRQIMMQMGQQVPDQEDPYEVVQQVLEYEKYEVQRVDLTKESPLPEDFDALVVLNPRGLNERQHWEINRVLHSGTPVIMAVQQYEWDYRPTQRGLTTSPREENPNVNPLLENYGLAVSKEILMDQNYFPLTIQTGGLSGLFGGGTQVAEPIQIEVISANMDEDTAITNRLSRVLYLWGTALEMDTEQLEELGLQADVLMTTGEDAWTVPSPEALQSFEPPADPDAFNEYPLMAMISGQFPDAYADAERPEWPEPQQMPNQPPMPQDDAPDPPAGPVEAQPGELILMGSSEMFRSNFIMQREAGHLDLFLNSVDAVTLSENLVNIRGRKPIDRTIEKPEPTKKTMWRLANYGLANIIIAAIGIGMALKRRRSRNAYTLSHGGSNA